MGGRPIATSFNTVLGIFLEALPTVISMENSYKSAIFTIRYLENLPYKGIISSYPTLRMQLW